MGTINFLQSLGGFKINFINVVEAKGHKENFVKKGNFKGGQSKFLQKRTSSREARAKFVPNHEASHSKKC